MSPLLPAQAPAIALPASLRTAFLPPPPALDPFVRSFFLAETAVERIDDIKPAGVPLLLVFLRGRADLVVTGNQRRPSHPVSLLTTLTHAHPVELHGPLKVFGATLTPLGWAALTGGKSASDHADQLVDAGDLMGPALPVLANQIIDGHRAGHLAPEDMLRMTSTLLLRLLQRVPVAHARLVGTVSAWINSSLSPKVADLQNQVLYSPRQLQRLVDRYFGLPPKQLAIKYRALRAAALLANPRTSLDQVSLVTTHFHDSAHLIREVRRYAGRTPERRQDQAGPVLSNLLDFEQVCSLGPHSTRGVARPAPVAATLKPRVRVR